MVDFVISLVLMPTLLSLVKPETAEAPHERYFLARGSSIARFSCGIRRRVMVSVGLALVAALGILRLRVDTNYISFFSADHPLGQSAAASSIRSSAAFTAFS